MTRRIVRHITISGVDQLIDDHATYYAVRIDVRKNEYGNWFARVPQLRGVYGEGDTEEEAVEELRQAMTAALEQYHADGNPVPWEPNYSTARTLVIKVRGKSWPSSASRKST